MPDSRSPSGRRRAEFPRAPQVGQAAAGRRSISAQHREASALVIVQPQPPLTQLRLQRSILLTQKHDYIPLLGLELSKQRRRAQGTVTVWTAVAGLDPQALVAVTLRPYKPGPTIALDIRAVIGKLPVKAPATLTT